MRFWLPAIPLLLLGPSLASAQAPSSLSAQFGFGVAARTDSPQAASVTKGVYAVARAGLPLGPSLRLVSELSLTRYPDEQIIRAVDLCPRPGPCFGGTSITHGLGVTGIGVGLQPYLGHGPLQVIVTGTAGGYWLYHRPPPVAQAAVGLRGSVGLGLRVDPRVRVLLEGSGLYLVGQSVRAANTRHIGLGLQVN